MGIEHSTEEQTEYKSHYMRSIPKGELFSEIDEVTLKIDRMMYKYEQETFHPLEKLHIKV